MAKGTGMTATVTLPERLDYQSSAALTKTLSGRDDAVLSIDAAKVRHVGTLALQIVMSSIASRAAQGLETHFINASDACVDQLALYGFSPESLTNPEGWS